MMCVGCLRQFSGSHTSLPDGSVLCSRCTFVVTVYHENGIDKHFTAGGLMPHRVSSHLRRAINAYDSDPIMAFREYAPNTLRRYEGIDVDCDTLTGLISDEFPFIKLDMPMAESLHLKDGDEVTIKNGDTVLHRKIVAHHKFTTRQAKDKGYGRSAFVAYFVPAEA